MKLITCLGLIISINAYAFNLNSKIIKPESHKPDSSKSMPQATNCINFFGSWQGVCQLDTAGREPEEFTAKLSILGSCNHLFFDYVKENDSVDNTSFRIDTNQASQISHSSNWSIKQELRYGSWFNSNTELRIIHLINESLTYDQDWPHTLINGHSDTKLSLSGADLITHAKVSAVFFTPSEQRESELYSSVTQCKYVKI